MKYYTLDLTKMKCPLVGESTHTGMAATANGTVSLMLSRHSNIELMPAGDDNSTSSTVSLLYIADTNLEQCKLYKINFHKYIKYILVGPIHPPEAIISEYFFTAMCAPSRLHGFHIPSGNLF